VQPRPESVQLLQRCEVVVSRCDAAQPGVGHGGIGLGGLPEQPAGRRGFGIERGHRVVETSTGSDGPGAAGHA
jgi:hypothetical protein